MINKIKILDRTNQTVIIFLEEWRPRIDVLPLGSTKQDTRM